LNTLQTSDIPCVFNLDGQRLVKTPELALVLEADTIFNRSEAGTVTSYLRALLVKQNSPTVLGVRFDKFTDGRSYSIASRLREIGYTGELHALGEINQELIFLLRRVGFTHFHIPDPGTNVLPPEIVNPLNGYYQAGADDTRAQWQVQSR
jgi:uncharacterized protein (DUF934 family)